MKAAQTPRQKPRKVHQPHLSVVQDARTIRTRERLRRAFLDLIQDQALDRITIRSICATAGVNYVTFFRHYPKKDRKSTRLNSSHNPASRMPSSA
jgi:AcrR family transcriptional regulator